MNTEALFDPEGNFLHALSISCEIPTFLPTFITYCLTVVLKKKKKSKSLVTQTHIRKISYFYKLKLKKRN